LPRHGACRRRGSFWSSPLVAQLRRCSWGGARNPWLVERVGRPAARACAL